MLPNSSHKASIPLIPTSDNVISLSHTHTHTHNHRPVSLMKTNTKSSTKY